MDPPLCANGCGFFGSYENHNMCSKCYKDQILNLNNKITESMGNIKISTSLDDPESEMREVKNEMISGPSESDGLELKKKKSCKSCNKKTGLLGFMCRCGDWFCGKHRYPEEHSCVVDFKQIGRQILSNQNPLCKADKLDQKI